MKVRKRPPCFIDMTILSLLGPFLGLGHRAQNQQSYRFVAHFSSLLVEEVDSGVDFPWQFDSRVIQRKREESLPFYNLYFIGLVIKI